jgi:DNA mismatch repair protein MSH5
MSTIAKRWRLSVDGAGLFCGVIQHLITRGQNCPKVLIATHFHDVFHPPMLDQKRLPINFLHMQVMAVSASGHIAQSHSSDDGTGTSTSWDDSFSTGVHETAPNGPEPPRGQLTYLYR